MKFILNLMKVCLLRVNLLNIVTERDAEPFPQDCGFADRFT